MGYRALNIPEQYNDPSDFIEQLLSKNKITQKQLGLLMDIGKDAITLYLRNKQGDFVPAMLNAVFGTCFPVNKYFECTETYLTAHLKTPKARRKDRKALLDIIIQEHHINSELAAQMAAECSTATEAIALRREYYRSSLPRWSSLAEEYSIGGYNE